MRKAGRGGDGCVSAARVRGRWEGAVLGEMDLAVGVVVWAWGGGRFACEGMPTGGVVWGMGDGQAGGISTCLGVSVSAEGVC